LSRPRSGRSSAPAGRTAAGRPGVFVQTPKSDIYVAMLGIALGAMILGVLLMVLIMRRYEFKVKVSALSPPASSARAIAALSENLSTVHL
jgi:hypothetical protein